VDSFDADRGLMRRNAQRQQRILQRSGCGKRREQGQKDNENVHTMRLRRSLLSRRQRYRSLSTTGPYSADESELALSAIVLHRDGRVVPPRRRACQPRREIRYRKNASLVRGGLRGVPSPSNRAASSLRRRRGLTASRSLAAMLVITNLPTFANFSAANRSLAPRERPYIDASRAPARSRPSRISRGGAGGSSRRPSKTPAIP